MRFSQLEKTTFGMVPMGGEFFVAAVPDPTQMAQMAKCKKTRLRANRLPEVHADPASLFTVAVDEAGHHRFVAGDDPVWVAAKGVSNDEADAAPESGDDSGHGPDDEGAAGESEAG